MFRRTVHPGDILRDELAEMGVTPTAFAREIGVPPNRISQIIAGKRSITGDTALRFGHWFGVEPLFWMNLQSQYDLALAERQSGDRVRKLPTAEWLEAVRERKALTETRVPPHRILDARDADRK